MTDEEFTEIVRRVRAHKAKTSFPPLKPSDQFESAAEHAQPHGARH